MQRFAKIVNKKKKLIITKILSIRDIKTTLKTGEMKNENYNKSLTT